jgi:hypothetical protein
MFLLLFPPRFVYPGWLHQIKEYRRTSISVPTRDHRIRAQREILFDRKLVPARIIDEWKGIAVYLKRLGGERTGGSVDFRMGFLGELDAKIFYIGFFNLNVFI